jgi:hypothetical protein
MVLATEFMCIRAKLDFICVLFDICRSSNYGLNCNKQYIKSKDTINVKGDLMYALKNLKKINRFRLTVLTAILLLITGFSTWLYTTSVIQGYTQLLDSSKLSTEKIWSYEGSLRWWKSTYTTTIHPLTAIMITVGIITLLGPTIWARMQQRHILKIFTDELELASTEEFKIE